MTIWIVYGILDDFEDSQQWAVAAYRTESLARAHAEAAQKWIDDNKHKAGLGVRIEYIEDANPFDPDKEASCVRTAWDWVAVELRDDNPVIAPNPTGHNTEPEERAERRNAP